MSRVTRCPALSQSAGVCRAFTTLASAIFARLQVSTRRLLCGCASRPRASGCERNEAEIGRTMRLFISISKSIRPTQGVTLIVPFVLFFALAGLAQITAPQTTGSPVVRFKGHIIGETAEEFYSTAKMAESKGMAKDYCKALLADPKVMQSYAEAKRNILDTEALIASADVAGCQQVIVALQGKDATVGNRYAADLGPGGVGFHSGKLVSIRFEVHAAYADVVADMVKKLGAVSQQGFVTYQNGFGATYQYGKANWKSGDLAATVEEHEHFVTVTVYDAKWSVEGLRQHEGNRPSTLE